MAWAKELAKTHLVFMSEYAENAEPGANIVWQRTYLGNARTGDRKKCPVRTDVLIKL